ncbi:UbiA family prenyltransferase [Rhizorhapis sp. SPR117]|uniref:UbiA family prenyltransferase n=1 Tax=Rhizorhapis sp. SPR117 TaxID=2912611 RepID=UPI001F02C67E|nr:UbiA family prenyltransferase [Rhizorhapis sp. SPR117]
MDQIMKAGEVGVMGSQAGLAASGVAVRRKGALRDYLAMARFDHVTKHVFIIPGMILAYALRDPSLNHSIMALVIGFGSAIAIASANYVINEWLDRHFDAFHPVKSGRTAVNAELYPSFVYIEYVLLAAVGLLLAFQLSAPFFYTSVLFLFSGLIYNVNPVRTKDRVYLDVISESVNNPIRLMLGWTMIDPTTLPPSSLLLAYWMGGAFLMGAKRLSEYRDISTDAGVGLLQRYRRSFKFYTAENLTVSCFLYAILSAFFIAIFLIKYRLEYIVALPSIAILFALYLWLSLLKNSIAQRPERLFRSRRLSIALGAVILMLLLATFVDMPLLDYLSKPSFISVK